MKTIAPATGEPCPDFLLGLASSEAGVDDEVSSALERVDEVKLERLDMIYAESG